MGGCAFVGGCACEKVDVAILGAVAVDPDQLKGRPLAQVCRARHLHEALAGQRRIGTSIEPRARPVFNNGEAPIKLASKLAGADD